MNQDLFDWILLLGRWLHITVAITWIGTSIFFMWLDRSFEINKSSQAPDHVGDLWMVHGGGFYHVEKLLMGPTRVPEKLHWFKWESYWTWLSGVFLILMIFYTGNGTFLLDSSVSNISYWGAVGLSVFSIVGSWIFYDLLWELSLTRRTPLIGHLLTLLWFGGMSYFLCQTLSGRAAYMHIGAMIGTWMTANVFMRIIPRQNKMVEASRKGESVNQEWAKNAKYRSTHNTYLTLPVIFIMISNHFPTTYGSRFNWLILLLISAAGACIREYFVVRLKNSSRSIAFLIAGIAIIAGVILFSAKTPPSPVALPQTNNESKPDHSELKYLRLKGIVTFKGPLPERKKLLLPLACATNGQTDVYANDIEIDHERLKNVLVRVSKGVDSEKYKLPPISTVSIDQRACQYKPRVVGVRVGQKLEFINSDTVFHNVRAISKNNTEFNVAMPKQNDRIIQVFDHPEILLQTKCSVHPWMSSWIAVLDHPFFSVTNSAGEFEIFDLPPGEYTLEAWHEVFGVQSKEITITANSVTNINFEFKK